MVKSLETIIESTPARTHFLTPIDGKGICISISVLDLSGNYLPICHNQVKGTGTVCLTRIIHALSLALLEEHADCDQSDRAPLGEVH